MENLASVYFKCYNFPSERSFCLKYELNKLRWLCVVADLHSKVLDAHPPIEDLAKFPATTPSGWHPPTILDLLLMLV